jgi:hypothetical protein
VLSKGGYEACKLDIFFHETHPARLLWDSRRGDSIFPRALDVNIHGCNDKDV